MAIRISGIVLPEKRLEVALTYIFGIGQSRARKILRETSIDLNKRPKDLSEAEVALLRGMIDKNYRVEGELRREIMNNIKRLKDIVTYRGSRHAKRLPVRGQRTKTNSRTVRGNVRKTAGSGKRIVAKK